MAGKIVQVNFKLNVSPQEYDAIVTPLAGAFASIPGLRWKIWLLNEAEQEAGGIYLFEDDEAVDAFVRGPLAAEAKRMPFLRDVSVKRFDVISDLSAVSRAPLLNRSPV